MRPSQRANDQLREISIERNVARYAEGSCLITAGGTKVLCTASLEDKPPPWLRGQGRGWVTLNTPCCRAPPIRAPAAR